MWISINFKLHTFYRFKLPVKWFYYWIIINIFVPFNYVNCVTKCQKALDAAAAVTAQVLAENNQLTKELSERLNNHHFHPIINNNQMPNQFFQPPSSLPNYLDSAQFDAFQPDANQMVAIQSNKNTNLHNHVHNIPPSAAAILPTNLPILENNLLVSQETTRAYRARPNNHQQNKYQQNIFNNNKNKLNLQLPPQQQFHLNENLDQNKNQFHLRGLINENLDQNQFLIKPFQISHKSTTTSSTNHSPHYFSSQQQFTTSASSSSSFLDNLRPPYILHNGDIYIAYFDCIDQSSLNVEQTSPLVQSAMSAVWSSHRLNQLNLTTSLMSIKIGVYYFDICNYNSNDSKDLDFRSNTVDPASINQQDHLNVVNQKWTSDEQIENYLKLIEYNSLNNWSSNNRNNGLGIVPKTGVRSYQRNGKQQVHKMKPIIGILIDISKVHPQSISKLNKIDLPVININQLPDYPGWIAEPGVSLGKRIFNVYPAVQQLCKGVFSLVKKLNWTFAILDFSKFENTTIKNDNNQVDRSKLSPQQQIFVKCLNKLASKDSAFTFRLDSNIDGQNLDNEILFLTSGKSQIFMNALVAGYLSNKPNRIVATLDNLGAQLDNAIIEHHLAGKRFHFPFTRKGRSLEEFNYLNGPFFIQPDSDVSSDFFDFFNIELRNANIQSKHRLMSKLSEQLLFKAFNSSSTISFTEVELNAIRPAVHYFKDNHKERLNNGEVHQKFNKLNQNLTKLLKSRNLFEVTNNPGVIHVIRGVWALGFTLSKLVKNVCTANVQSSMERKKNCINRIQQVLDSDDKQFIRNITANLNEKVNIKMNNHMNNTFEEDKLHFDKNLQLTTVHFTVNKLNNSQLVKIASFTECCGLRTIKLDHSNNLDYLNTSMQPMYFNNAYSVVSSSNHYQINKPTQSTPSFGTRLSTRKTTIFINPIKQTSTTMKIESTSNSTESSLQPEMITDTIRNKNNFKLNLNNNHQDDSKNDDFFTETNKIINNLPIIETETDSTNKNRIETTTMNSIASTIGTTLSTVEVDVIRISAEPTEPEINDILLSKSNRQTLNNMTRNNLELSLNKRNNQNKIQHHHIDQKDQFIPTNQTRYIRKSIKKQENNNNQNNNLPFTSTTTTTNLISNRRKSKTTKPYIKEQILIKNGKIALNSTADNINLLDSKATIESVTSDRHSLNQFKKDNEIEIERRFSIVILFLSIGGSLLTLYVFIFLLVKGCEGAFKYHSHQALALTQLIAILIVYCSSGLYIFQLNNFTINLRNSIHNVALALLFACLLQRALFIRAQQWIGLGGKISMLNQCITLLLIFGVQLALEVQKWSYENSTTIHDFSLTSLTRYQTNANQFLNGQCYLMIISLLVLLISFSARQQPFTYKEGKHIYLTSLICCPLYLGSVLILYKYLITMNNHNQHLQNVALNSTFNLSNAQSLQWSSNTLFLNNSIKFNQTDDESDLITTTISPILNENTTVKPISIIKNSTLPRLAMRSSVEYLPRPLNLFLSNESNGLIKLKDNFNKPIYDYLQMFKSNLSTMNNLEFLENVKEYTDYQHKLTVIKFVDLVQSFVLLVLATITLFGIFGPMVYRIYKYGVLPKKQNSYTDSLSTAFTLFKTGSNSQQHFVINKNAKQKSFFTAFAFNQRKKDNSLNVHHSQFKQLTNSLQSPVHLQCSSTTITESSATSESSFTHTDTHTDNISDTDQQQSPTTSQHHFHHHHHHHNDNQKSIHCEEVLESNDEDNSINENNSSSNGEDLNNEIQEQQQESQQPLSTNSNGLVRPPPPPLPTLQQMNLIKNSNAIKTNTHIGSGPAYNYTKTLNQISLRSNYDKSFKYVINNLMNENLGHNKHQDDDLISSQKNNLKSSGHKSINSSKIHPPLKNSFNSTTSSKSKPRLIRTNPIFEEKSFRSAYP